MAKITMDMVKKGFQSGIVRLVIDPNLDNGTVCQIGEEWFYFGGMTAEEMIPDEYCRDIPEEDIIQEICDALDGLERNSHDEYLYYYYFLSEHACGVKPIL